MKRSEEIPADRWRCRPPLMRERTVPACDTRRKGGNVKIEGKRGKVTCVLSSPPHSCHFIALLYLVFTHNLTSQIGHINKSETFKMSARELEDFICMIESAERLSSAIDRTPKLLRRNNGNGRRAAPPSGSGEERTIKKYF